MKKVVYSVTRFGRTKNFPMKGVGYITDNDLIIACNSKAGKPYIRVFEDCINDCHKIIGTEDEYKGAYYEIREIEFERQDGSKEARECDIFGALKLRPRPCVATLAFSPMLLSAALGVLCSVAPFPTKTMLCGTPCKKSPW